MYKYNRLDNPTLGWLFTIVIYVPFDHYNPTWTELGVNPGIHGERPATTDHFRRLSALGMAVSTPGPCRERCKWKLFYYEKFWEELRMPFVIQLLLSIW